MAYNITTDQLTKIAGNATPLMPELVDWINKLCPTYDISTPQEYAHFLAQACHETAHFRTLQEYATGSAYEGRNDLGNTQPGDGVKFKGRGIFQTTGRKNYTDLGKTKGDPNLFINAPNLLEKPEYAVWSACEYWKKHNFHDKAILPDSAQVPWPPVAKTTQVSPVEYISRIINGGDNGLTERKKLYALAKSVLV